MSNNSSVSLIVTTYNWPEALEVCLKSVLTQTRPPDEIVIADDGSDERTALTIKSVLGPSTIKWLHVWHPDKGVRQSRIKNLAVKNAQGDYLIFIDHDTILHKEFIREHLKFAEKGCFLQGKRVLLGKEITDEILTYRAFRPISFFSLGIKNRKNMIHLPFIARVNNLKRSFQTSLRGCNLSMYREDFILVDGFDEIYDGSWGREDSDICYRLFNAKLSIKNLRFVAIQYHMFHPRPTSWDQKRLDSQLEEVLREKRIKAIKGFSKLTSEGTVLQSSMNFLSY